MESPLTGRNAIVTGSSRGIGRAVAQRLARDGARVIVNYSRHAGEAQSCVEEIRQSGGMADALQADVASLVSVQALFEHARELHGPLDILVNNAGIAIFKPAVDVTDEEYDAVFNLNARGVFYCLREAARTMRDGGRIVNISSGATISSGAGGAIYCGSKAAVEQFTRAFAKELAPRSVTVNTVSPGFTESDMLRQIPKFIEVAPSRTPLGRLGQPGDIADVVAWICSPDARWITGQNIQASGGLTMV
jgi:3-oxoacyl-[acyl-carrier protein] reductase